MSALLFDVFVEALHIAVNEDRAQTHFGQFQTSPPAVAEAIHRRRAFEKEIVQEVAAWSCWCCPAAALEGPFSNLPLCTLEFCDVLRCSALCSPFGLMLRSLSGVIACRATPDHGGSHGPLLVCVTAAVLLRLVLLPCSAPVCCLNMS